jgi:AmpE protein
MVLIGVLVAILFERVLGHWPLWGRLQIVEGLIRLAARLLPFAWLWTHPLILLLWWALPVWAVHVLIGEISSPVLATLLSAGVLLLCLGPRDLTEDLHRLREAREAGDADTEARLLLILRVGVPQPEASHRSLLGSLFIQSHERLFGVLTGFLFLGPAGALAYRLASRLPRQLREVHGECAAAAWADRLHQWLAWVPARLTALLFGLAGSLDDALAAWKRLLENPEPGVQTWTVLSEVAAAAVVREGSDGAPSVPGRLEECLDEVLRMQGRALLILLAVFAVATTGAML